MRAAAQHLSRLLTLAWLAMLCGAISGADSIGPIRVEDLFSSSNVVVMARVVSGNAEAYQHSATDPVSWPVCKLRVTEAFKGARKGGAVFLASCAEMALDGQYILFLQNAKPPVLKAGFERDGYGPLRDTKQVSDAGYGAMRIEYACVFDGRVPDQSCDYGVKLNSTQVILPKSLRIFPKSRATAETNYKRWVRRKDFLVLLNSLAERTGAAN